MDVSDGVRAADERLPERSVGDNALGENVVAVNLGLMWAEAGSALLVEAQSKARALWTDVRRKWTGLRTQKGYQAHQHLIQTEFAKQGERRSCHPSFRRHFRDGSRIGRHS